jgi:hypothetical protein
MDDKTTHRVDYIEHPLGERFVHQGERYVAPQGELDTMTNYTKDYTRKPMETVKPIRQLEGPKILGKFEGQPTYAADYRKWDPQQRELIKADNHYSPPTAPFDDKTNYNTDFIPKQQAPRESMRPNEAALRSDMPFDDATEHNQKFVRHPLQAREPRKEVSYEPNTAPLDDLTTNRRDFTPKELGKAVSFKPENNAYQSTTPFDGSTTHNADYVKWQLERPQARDPQIYQKPPGEMDMLTTTHSDYTKKPLDRQLAKRPQEAVRTPGKFDDTTNYKSEYLKWGPGERAQPMAQPVYQPNDAPFDGIPTYQRDYVPKKGEMARSLKPIDTPYRSLAPMDDATEYNKEYIKKWVPPCPVPIIEGGTDIGYVYRDQDDVGHKWYDFVANQNYERFKSGKMYGTLVK